MFESKIVITGMGMVSALGSELDAALSQLAAGCSGIQVDTENPYCHYSAAVQGYEATRHVPAKLLRRMERVNHFAINAVGDALAMAQLTSESDLEDTGVLVGTGYAGIESVVKHQKSLFDDGIQMLRPIYFPNTVYNATAGLISIQFKTRGVNSTLTGLDMPSEYALLYACMVLQRHPDAKVVVVGADSCTERLQQGIHHLGFLTRRRDDSPLTALDKNVDGLVMGEGAGAVVLETAEGAKNRGAKTIATLRDIVQSSTAVSPFNYDTSPTAALSAIDRLTTNLGFHLQEYDLLGLSATGVPTLAQLETDILKAIVTAGVPCRALSDYLGAFPGAGVLRLLLAIASLQKGSSIAPLPGDPAPEIEPLLNKNVCGRQHYLHLVNGLGGSAMAIDVEVHHD